jgi:hypothetical protein
MGLLTQIFTSSGSTPGGPPFLLSESNRLGTHGTKPRQQPPSAWQVNFGFEKSNLPYCGEVVKCSILSRIIGRVPRNVNRVLLSQFHVDRCTD